MSINKLNDTYDGSKAWVVNTITKISKLLEKNEKLLTTSGVSFAQSYKNISQDLSAGYLPLTGNINNYFKDANNIKGLMVEEHQWSNIDKTNFYYMIKKCNNLDIENTLINSYSNFAHNLSQSFISNPGNLSDKFLKISELLTYTQSIPYNNLEFIKNLIETISPEVFEGNNFNKINSLVSAIVLNTPKEQVLSLAEKTFKDNTVNIYEYYTNDEVKNVSTNLENRAKLLKQQSVGHKPDLIAKNVQLATIAVSGAFSLYHGYELLALDKIGIPTATTLADEATTLLEKLNTKSFLLPVVITTCVLALPRLLSIPDFAKELMWRNINHRNNSSLTGDTLSNDEILNTQLYLNAIKSKSSNKIIDRLVRKPNDYFDFNNKETKKIIAINLLINEKINNHDFIITPNSYINQSECDILNSKSIEKIIEISNVSDPYIMSSLFLNNNKLIENSLFELDAISNSKGRDRKINNNFENFLNKTSINNSKIKEHLNDILTLFNNEDPNLKNLISNICSIAPKTGIKPDVIINTIVNALNKDTPLEKEKAIQEIVKSSTELCKFDSKDSFEITKHVRDNIFQPIEPSNTNSILSISNELNLDTTFELLKNKRGIIKNSKEFCLNKFNSIKDKILNLRENFSPIISANKNKP